MPSAPYNRRKTLSGDELATGHFPRIPAGGALVSGTRAPSFHLFLVHGLHEHSGRYHDLIESLVSRGGLVTTVDLRGHGRSGCTGDVPDLGALVDDLLALEHEDYEAHCGNLPKALPRFLFGHSFGGLISLLMLRRAPPGRFSGCALSAPAVEPSALASARWPAAFTFAKGIICEPPNSGPNPGPKSGPNSGPNSEEKAGKSPVIGAWRRKAAAGIDAFERCVRPLAHRALDSLVAFLLLVLVGPILSVAWPKARLPASPEMCRELISGGGASEKEYLATHLADPHMFHGGFTVRTIAGLYRESRKLRFALSSPEKKKACFSRQKKVPQKASDRKGNNDDDEPLLIDCPLFIAHGSDDTVTWPGGSWAVAASHRVKGVTLRVVPGHKHEVLWDTAGQAIRDEMIAWIVSTAGKAA